jgi:hypothetical protein
MRKGCVANFRVTSSPSGIRNKDTSSHATSFMFIGAFEATGLRNERGDAMIAKATVDHVLSGKCKMAKICIG